MNSPARRRQVAAVAAVVGAALVALGLTGCEGREPASPPPSAPTMGPSVNPSMGPAGSEGLTVRYLDGDGKITSLPVEDFPR